MERQARAADSEAAGAEALEMVVATEEMVTVLPVEVASVVRAPERIPLCSVPL